MDADAREQLGRLVREEWVAWAKEQPNPKPHWLTAWEDLEESHKEVDRRIGVALFSAGVFASAKILEDAGARALDVSIVRAAIPGDGPGGYLGPNSNGVT